MAFRPIAGSLLRLPTLDDQDSGSEDLRLQPLQPTDAGTVSDSPDGSSESPNSLFVPTRVGKPAGNAQRTVLKVGRLAAKVQ